MINRASLCFLCATLLLCSSGNDLLGQWASEGSLPVYPADEVTTIKIEIALEDITTIYLEDSLFSNHEYPATFIFQSNQLTDTVENVGFRLRGNTSRLAAKKSFKVSFNTFSPGATWNGVQKLNLNGEHNDPSIMRSKIGWEMAQEAGLVAPFVSYSRVYINETYAGLYINVEHYDENFLERHYGTAAGNLFKCHYPADLNYISSNPEEYKTAPWNGVRTYELKTNKDADDYRGLAHFIDVLNNTSSSELHCRLDEVFDINKYLKTLAFELIIGHWDGYTLNNNNFYLFQRPSDGKFEFIEYDIDNTAGIDWFGINWATRNIYDYNSDNRPLYERLLANDVLRGRFTYFVYQYMTEFTELEDIHSRLEEIQALITEAALEDEFRTYDYGFGDEAFLTSLDEAAGGHVSSGIDDYFTDRFAWNYIQLESTEPYLLFDIEDNVPFVEGDLTVFVTPSLPADEVELVMSTDVTDDVSLTLNDLGVNGDLTANDGIWSIQVEAPTNATYIDYSAIVTSGNLVAQSPCPSRVWVSPTNDELVINEVMTSNQLTIADEDEDYDDWFELWNGNGAPVLPSNYWVSDNLDFPFKYRLSGNAIPQSGFQLLWADDEGDEGINHVNFQLASTGEELILFKLQENDIRVVDYISFPALSDDISYGRETDGNSSWVSFDSPTPNAPNGVVSVSALTATEALPYPNPTTGIVYFNLGPDWKVFDISGKQLPIVAKGGVLDLSALSSGVYFLQSEGRIMRILKN